MPHGSRTMFFGVRQAWRVARKRNQFGYGGHAGDLEVTVTMKISARMTNRRRPTWAFSSGISNGAVLEVMGLSGFPRGKFYCWNDM